MNPIEISWIAAHNAAKARRAYERSWEHDPQKLGIIGMPNGNPPLISMNIGKDPNLRSFSSPSLSSHSNATHVPSIIDSGSPTSPTGTIGTQYP